MLFLERGRHHNLVPDDIRFDLEAVGIFPFVIDRAWVHGADFDHGVVVIILDCTRPQDHSGLVQSKFRRVEEINLAPNRNAFRYFQGLVCALFIAPGDRDLDLDLVRTFNFRFKCLAFPLRDFFCHERNLQYLRDVVKLSLC